MSMVRSLQKSKRVSWASDINLCQIRLFLSDESPSQVGVGGEDNLQVKASWLVHSTGGASEDQLPPGFEGSHSTVDHLKKDVSQIPLVKWQRPPKFVLNPHWQVVAGEENEETEVQKQREMRVLEAIYPRASAIPPNPSAPIELEDTRQHFEYERNIPLIPVTPIEDEEVAQQPPPKSVALTTTSNNSLLGTPLPPSQCFLGHQGIPMNFPSNIGGAPKALNTTSSSNEKLVPGVEPDVVAAASAAFTAIMKSNEQGSLIDRELLIKILSNPELIEKLVVDYGTCGNNSSAPPLPVSYLNNRVEPPPMSSSLPAPPGLFHPVPPPTPPPPTFKDINYYKSLIQQHGGEKIESQEQQQQQQQQQYVNYHNQQQQQFLGSKTEASNIVLRGESETSSKKKRTCLYFNSSRGCKKGASCMYQHDVSCAQPRMQSEAQNPKRMKLDREITGRT
ncbi:hypothetical protein ACHQM5_024703 [Ranunculus cassubicifolius]